MKIKNSLTAIIIVILTLGLCLTSFYVIGTNTVTDDVESENVVMMENEDKLDESNLEPAVKETKSKKTDKKEALYEDMLFQRWFPEINWEISEKNYSELTEEERKIQDSTAFYLGYKKLTNDQTSALLEVQKDGRDQGVGAYDWMPYGEFIALGVIEPVKERVTLEKARMIIEKTDSFDEALDRFLEIQNIPDVVHSGNNYSRTFEYWIDDEGSKAILLYGGYHEYGETKMIGEKKIEYVEMVNTELGWRTSSSEILAEYDEELNKITGKTYERIEHKMLKLPELKDLYDWKESEKIRSELSDEQENAQKDTSKYIGYKYLTEEQYKALSDIQAQNSETDKKYILKMLAAIGEADLQQRLTLDEVKSIISDIDDIESYQFKDVILMISNELKYRKYYPDFTQKYYYQEEGYTMKTESSQSWYWLDDNETKCIVITFGLSIVYGEMKDGELKIVHPLFQSTI